MRINKYLAACGTASRRECDKMIAEGKVTVNGKKAVIGQEVGEDDEVLPTVKKPFFKKTNIIF